MKIFDRLLDSGLGEFQAGLNTANLTEMEISISPYQLSEELKSYYSSTDGCVVEEGVFEFLSFENSLKKRDDLGQLFSGGIGFPPALFPILTVGIVDYFAVLSRTRQNESEIVSYCMADGDCDFVHASPSWAQMINEMLDKKDITEPVESSERYSFSAPPASWYE